MALFTRRKAGGEIEARSVTPFAPRTLDHGLAALLAGIVRQSGPHYNQNTTAGDLTADAPELASAIASMRIVKLMPILL